MPLEGRTVLGAVLCGLVATAAAQDSGPRVPLSDPVERRLVPTGILEVPIHLNAELAYAFKDKDGIDALHLIGNFVLSTGDGEGYEFRSREAVVWISNREHQGRTYRHLEVFLWQGAQIYEIGGSTTAGPAIFAALNTFATVDANVDDVALKSSAGSQRYEEGNAIRRALAEAVVPGSDFTTSLTIFDLSGLAKKRRDPKPRPTIRFDAEGEVRGATTPDGLPVLTITGGVYLSRGTPGEDDFLDLRADSIVLFLAPGEALPRIDRAGPAGLGGEARAGARGAPAKGEPDRQFLAGTFGNVAVQSAYLEGDVVMSQGPNSIRASRVYYDFLKDRASILDAVARVMLLDRGIPLYVRAAEIRQLSRSRYTATDARVTTSEFFTPHYHIGAGRFDLVDLTPGTTDGGQVGARAGSFRIRNATLNVGGYPIAYWPYIQGNIDTSETAIRGLRTGFSDDFGLELETDWHLFNVAGLETPEGFDATLSLDFFTERGPAVGVSGDYQRDDYFGLVRSYLLVDSGQDDLGRDREEQSERDVRGRLLVRHRQYLPDDWQLSFELSYISDESFLEEFFKSEFDNDKEQETLLYLKKQRENWALTATFQTRILDFTTQTERLPDLAYLRLGEPIGRGLAWYTENRLGAVRYRPANRSFVEFLRNGEPIGSGAVLRVDSRQEINLPIDVGPARFIPFAVLRGSMWDDSPGDGGLSRVLATYGVRGSMYFSKVYPNAHSELLDIDGVRHIVKPDLVAWISHTNRDPHELFPFDETAEGADEADGIALGVRQRWQTKRGIGESRRVVDFLEVDTEVGIFNDGDSEEVTNGLVSFSRPENSISRNYVNSTLIWQLNDRTALLSELNYDLNDGEVDVFNVSLAVERSPRFTYLLGYRFIEESNSNLMGFDMNYRLTEKHTLALRELFDIARGETLDFTVALIRRFPRWFGAISFALDEAEDDFGVSISIWPEGLPQAALGSRRFTGISDISRLRGY